MERNRMLLSILGLLADEDKLKVTAAVALGAGTVSEIGNATGLESPKIIKTLAGLGKAGLVENTGNDGYRYCARVLKELNLEFSRSLGHKPEAKQIDRFIRNGQLLTFPKSRNDRFLVLTYTVNLFEPNRRYTETEVNVKLGALHPDFAALRRWLVDYGFLARESVTKNDHTIVFYWRIGQN